MFHTFRKNRKAFSKFPNLHIAAFVTGDLKLLPFYFKKSKLHNQTKAKKGESLLNEILHNARYKALKTSKIKRKLLLTKRLRKFRKKKYLRKKFKIKKNIKQKKYLKRLLKKLS